MHGEIDTKVKAFIVSQELSLLLLLKLEQVGVMIQV